MKSDERSAKDLARLLGIGPSQFYALRKAGVFKPVSRGRYDLGASVRAYIEHLTGKGNVASARQALLEEQRRRLKLANDAREGRLLDFDDVQAVHDAAAHAYVQSLEALPGRLASELAGMSDAGLIHARLRTEVRSIRAGVSQEFKNLVALAHVDHAKEQS